MKIEGKDSPRWALLAGLLLLPLWARADALDAVALMVELLAAVYGVALLTALLVVWAYRRPASQTLRVAQGILLLLCALLGWSWGTVFNSLGSSPSFFLFNPFLTLCLPLGAWLNGLTQARRARTDAARLGWLGLAIVGLQFLLGALIGLALPRATTAYNSPWQTALHWAVALGTALASWWLVLGQAQPTAALSAVARHPWWKLPTVVAGLGAVGELLPILVSTPMVQGGVAYRIPWFDLLPQILAVAVGSWAVGVVALRLKRPAPAPAANDRADGT